MSISTSGTRFRARGLGPKASRGWKPMTARMDRPTSHPVSLEANDAARTRPRGGEAS